MTTILDMNNASNHILSNLSRIPSDLHTSILSLLGDAAVLSNVRMLVGNSTAPAAPKGAVAGPAAGDGAPAPLPLSIVVKPRSAEAAPKRIYVTAPKYMQEGQRSMVESAIAAVKKLWPEAEIIDANKHWPEGERRGPAWEAGFADLIKTVDAIVVVTNEEGWVGGGIEMEMRIANGAGRHVLAVRSPGGGNFIFYQEVVVEKFRGAGSKSKVPSDIRKSVVGYIVFEEELLLTATHIDTR